MFSTDKKNLKLKTHETRLNLRKQEIGHKGHESRGFVLRDGREGWRKEGRKERCPSMG